MKLCFVVIVVALFSTVSFAKEVLLVGNNKAGTVSVIDASTFTHMCQINVVPDLPERNQEFRETLSTPLNLYMRAVNLYAGFAYADDLRLSPDKTVMYVSRGSVRDVAAFELKTGRLLWRVPVAGYRSDHLTVSADGKHLFVSAIEANKVQMIDVGLREVVAEIDTDDQPHMVVLSNDGTKVFIGEKEGRNLIIADAKTFKVINKFNFESGVRPFVFDKNEMMYVQLSRFHGFLKYDYRTNTVLARKNLPETDKSRSYNGDYPKDAAHHGIALSPDGKHLCIAGTSSDYVALLDLPAMNNETFIPVSGQPGWAINSLNGQHCYVSAKTSNSISVISYSERREVRSIPTDFYPQRMVTADVPAICGVLN